MAEGEINWPALWGTRTPSASMQTADTVKDVPQKRPGLPEAPKNDPFSTTPLALLSQVSIELPVSEIQQWNVPTVLQAMIGHENGQFGQSALLASAMTQDPRIMGPMSIRTKTISGLPIDFLSAKHADETMAKKAAEMAAEQWSTWINEQEAEKHHRWMLSMGFSIGQLLWLTDLDPWQPRFNVWNPCNSFAFWDGYNRNFWRWQLITTNSVIEPIPGDGQWVFARTTMKEPWMEGLLRALCLRFVARYLSGLKSWSRYNEKQGLAILKLIAPADASDPQIRQQFERQARNLGSEPTFTLRQGEKGNIWDVVWEECKAQGFETFRQMMDAFADEMSIAILGQNLTSSIKKGGSYAAAKVHQDVRRDLVEADARMLGTMWREQVLRPWASLVFGDPDLAPILKYRTDPPEDINTKTKALQAFASAIKSLAEAGVKVDVGTIDAGTVLDEMGIPTTGILQTAQIEEEPVSTEESDDEATEAAEAAEPG